MRSFSVALLALIAAGCAKPPATPTSNPVSLVEGQVLDYRSGAPVAGAAIAFGSANLVSDARGVYMLMAPPGEYQPTVDGAWMGRLFLAGPAYRGDFLIRGGTCVARYGVVRDAATFRPVSGATVSVREGGSSRGSAVTALDGWYRIDLGCPSNGHIGSNTADVQASHANYRDWLWPTGRGVGGVTRVDFDLHRR